MVERSDGLEVIAHPWRIEVCDGCDRPRSNMSHGRCPTPFRGHYVEVVPVEWLRTQVVALENAGMETAAKLGEAEAEIQRLKAEGLEARDRLLIVEGLGCLQQLNRDDEDRVERLREALDG